MMKYIIPTILIGVSIAFFFMVTNPLYSGTDGVTGLQTQIDSYNQALNTSEQLQNERDQLTATYNNIDPDNLTKLQTLLPDSVNNIRLILEIQQIASTYGMQLTDVKYSTTNIPTTSDTTATGGSITPTSSQSQDYGTFNLGFSTTGTYDNFISFTKNLESNLRIVDISSIIFSSDTSATPGTQTTTSTTTPTYKYDFNIQTYWLKS